MENRQKEGDDCYTLTSEDFTAIRDELAEDFAALADELLVQVRQLVAQLDDDRLDAQIQFESYERSRLREEKERQGVTVNLSDDEESVLDIREPAWRGRFDRFEYIYWHPSFLNFQSVYPRWKQLSRLGIAMMMTLLQYIVCIILLKGFSHFLRLLLLFNL